jgi:hypothetical protein
MYARFALSLLAGVTLLSMPAFANSWHRPEIYEETHGDYSNYRYDDGLCQYRYYYNAYEQHAEVNKYGDCDHIMIGPDGHVIPSEMEAPE